MKDRVRVGVIGAGRFATECHIPGIQAHPQAEVVALCARNRERVDALATRFDVPQVYTDYQELLSRTDIDAVAVATPDALHFPVTTAALSAGKHVFCEKPLATSEAEARQMTDLADGSGLVAMVAFTYRYTLALRALQRLVQEGSLGTPFGAAAEVHWGGIGFPRSEVSWREDVAQSGAGVWGDGGSHLFDALAFTLGPVRAVCAQMLVVQREPGTPQPSSVDMATCLARLSLDELVAPVPALSDRQPGTVHVALITSKVDQPRLRGDRMEVVGTRGAAEITLSRGDREHLYLVGEDGAWREVDLSQRESVSAGGTRLLGRMAGRGQPPVPAALIRMMGAFVDAVLRGRLAESDPSFRDGLRAQQALAAGLRSAQSERWEQVGV